MNKEIFKTISLVIIIFFIIHTYFMNINCFLHIKRFHFKIIKDK
jgi:hypothetical protein